MCQGLLPKKGKMNEDQERAKKLDKLTSQAMAQLEKESDGKKRDFLSEWYRYVEIVSKFIKTKILN